MRSLKIPRIEDDPRREVVTDIFVVNRKNDEDKGTLIVSSFENREKSNRSHGFLIEHSTRIGRGIH